MMPHNIFMSRLSFLFLVVLWAAHATADTSNTCQLNLKQLFADWSCNSRLERAGCLTVAAGAAGFAGVAYGRYKAAKDVDKAIEYRLTARAKIVQEIDAAKKTASQATEELNKLALEMPKNLRAIESKYDFERVFQAELQRLFNKDPDYKFLKALEELIKVDEQKRSQVVAELNKTPSPAAQRGYNNQIVALTESIKSRQKQFDALSETLSSRHGASAKSAVAKFTQGKELDKIDLFIKLDDANNKRNLNRKRAEILIKELANFDRVTPRYLKSMSQKVKAHGHNMVRLGALMGAGFALAAWEVGYLMLGYTVETAMACDDIKLAHPYICRAEKTCWENYQCSKVQDFLSLEYNRQQELLNKDPTMCQYYSKLSGLLQLPAQEVNYSCANRELKVAYGIPGKSQKYTRSYSIPPIGINSVEVHDEKSNLLDDFAFDQDGKLTEFNSYTEAGVKNPASLKLYEGLQTIGAEDDGKSYKMRDLYVARNLIPLAQQCCHKSQPSSEQFCEDLQSYVLSVRATTGNPATKNPEKVR